VQIADLEITNKSLLTINATLEAAKHRQAREIRDLRRRLRESKLSMPPRMFRLMREQDPSGAEDPDEPEDEEDEDEAEDDAAGADAGYLRVRALVDGLLTGARTALAATPASVLGERGGAKVLSAEEARSWRHDDGEISFVSEGPSALFLDALEPADDDGSATSEAADEHEIEKSLLLDFAFAPRAHSPAPPIVVSSPS
jgi:hypothetical protein